ncbi:hybrid sensor histidine kinase/response regulator [Piscinibacter terrae]|uniref:histidine kinase n=1 Tax=Piscinibacter terrae TaxID=2496871 RepID=A0A3N7HTI5_9BURK|nr:ATP-binding protein [Albitalea terrae]RQP25554.1 HAMP domain-containing protein [Albitalea terrae]
MRLLPRFSVDRVRTRLLAAFTILLLAGVALAVVGWLGMRSMQRELAGYEEEVLPGIARALELAERTAQIAAIAPHLADSRTPETLETNAAVVAGLLDDIKRRSLTLPPSGELQPAMSRRLEGVDRDLSNLIMLTKLRQSIDSRLERQIIVLSHIGTRIHASGRQGKPGDPAVAEIWSSLVLGATTDKAATLGRLQADVEALLIAARQRHAFDAFDEEFVREVEALATGPDNILSLRRDLLDYESRTNYLVALTRSNADRLSDEVAQHVAQLRNTAALRNDSVQRAIRRGETGMLVLAIVCVVIGLGATRYVRRLIAQVENITHVMSRLAQGDVAQETPATTRRDELGELARSFEVFRDNLLAKQKLLADLKNQRELLEAVHESLTDALAVFDHEHRLILWNPQLVKLLGPLGITPRDGMTRKEMLQSLPRGTAWCHAGDAEAQPLDPERIDGVTVFEHVELRLPEGQVLDLRSRAMPDGGTVTLMTDMTARRNIEAQLQHSQKLDVLGQLTGGVAHDFNNYLGTILGNLSLLEERVAGEVQTHAQWKRVQRAATSAAALTRRLLAFARRQPLQAEHVPVDEMVEEMQDLIEYSAGPQVAVSFDLRSEPAQLHVDRGQLENALLNLVLNSAAAMPDGGELRVATRAAGGMVEIDVSDTGRGIPEHQQRQVFDPFFTTKKAGEGSGLGLSIVYGFVKQSGGDVGLQSRLGKGTTVTLRFPAQASAAAATDARHAAAPPVPLDNVHVLLVDDDDAFRATLTDMLVREGLRVTAVPSAEQALTLLERGASPDVMLSDICLGSGMDGLRFAHLARDRWPELPLGLMSGLSPELLPNAEQWDPAFAFVHKPFEPAQLAHWLARLLADANERPETSSAT